MCAPPIEDGMPESAPLNKAASVRRAICGTERSYGGQHLPDAKHCTEVGVHSAAGMG